MGGARRNAIGALATGLAASLLAGPGAAQTLNGFDTSGAGVPRELLVAGGPKRDGIRSVDAPSFVPLGEATWIDAATPVLGVTAGGVARMYPVHLLEYHQIVNDELGGVPLAVTWDPLTSLPRVFHRRLEGEKGADAQVLEFGVSGLVYNGGFLMYDRQTESLWSQFRGEAIAGPLAGRRLARETVRHEPVGVWLARHPRSVVLAPPDPERIDYRFSPFTEYWVKNEISYPVAARDTRYHAKEVVVGVSHGGRSRAYLGSIATREGGRIDDELGGARIRLAYDPETSTFRVDVPEGVEFTESYWLAWKAFLPAPVFWTYERPAASAAEPRDAEPGDPEPGE